MPDLAARPADQRRPVPRAGGRPAAGPRGQRGEAGRDAHVDDLSDDGRRHDLQGAGAGDPRRRSSPATTPISCVGRVNGTPAQGRPLLHLSRRADRRRLGRQARQRRHERDHRDQRRRHAQRPVRADRGEVPDARRALRAAAGFRRRRHASAAGSAPSRWCRRATRSASTPRSTASNAAPGACSAVVGDSATASRSIASARTSTALPERQGVQPGAQAGRRLHPALGRRRRLRLAAGSRSRRAGKRRARRAMCSRAAAERDYGAVFAAGSDKLDIAATEERRAAMRAQGLPHDEPIADTGVPPPAAAHHHHHDHAHEKLTEEERVALAMTGRCCS